MNTPINFQQNWQVKKTTTAQRRNNLKRARIAEGTIKQFIAETSGEFCEGESLDIGLRDLLSDLMHLCDREGWNFWELESQARHNYCEESQKPSVG